MLFGMAGLELEDDSSSAENQNWVIEIINQICNKKGQREGWP